MQIFLFFISMPSVFILKVTLNALELQILALNEQEVPGTLDLCSLNSNSSSEYYLYTI